MPFLTHLKTWLRKCDSFKTTALMRYRQEPEYQTLTGGIFSLLVILAFMVIFTNTVIKTIEKTLINSSRSLEEEIQPSEFTTSETPLLFAIGVTGMNLNAGRYFDIVASQKIQDNINNTKRSITITLVPCDRAEWYLFSENLGQLYDKLGLAQWLCLPNGTVLTFQGKFTSDLFQYVKITLQACNNATNFTNKCLSPAAISAVVTPTASFNFNFYFVNTLINEQDSNYLNYYLEDKNYFTFSATAGSLANLFFSSYNIDTDNSLLPTEDISTDTGGYVYEAAQVFITQGQAQYVQLYLRKSSLAVNITRSFQKVDSTLSYIGGLFSSIMSVIFLMSLYNQYAYEIQIGARLYDRNKKEKLNSDQFNFWRFLLFLVWVILRKFGLNIKSELMIKFDENKEELGRQLDIHLLVKKITFLEDCMTFLFDEHELMGLHLKGKLTLEEATKIRLDYKILRKTRDYVREHTEKNHEETTMYAMSKELIQEGKDDGKDGRKDVHSLSPVRSTKQIHSEFQMGGIEPRRQRREITEIFSDDDEEEVKEEEKNQFIANIKECILKLKTKTEKGDKRSKKIYESIDPEAKEILKIRGKFLNIMNISIDEMPENRSSAIEEQNINLDG